MVVHAQFPQHLVGVLGEHRRPGQVRGRLVEWGPLPGPSELADRTECALDHPPGRTVVPKDEVDEVRIVASWVAEHEPAELALDPAPRRAALMEFAGPRVPSLSA